MLFSSIFPDRVKGQSGKRTLRASLAIVLACALSIPLPSVSYATEGASEAAARAESGTSVHLEGRGADAAASQELSSDLAETGKVEGAAVSPLSESDAPSAQPGDVASLLSGGSLDGSEEDADPQAVDEPRSDCVAGEVVVVLDDAGASSVRLFSGDEPEASPLDELGVTVLEEVASATEGTGTVITAQVSAGKTIDDTVAELSRVPGVAHVQPNYLYSLVDSVAESSEGGSGSILSGGDSSSALSVNDPLCNDSSAYNANQYYLYQSKTVDAWEKAQVSDRVTVAVLDTGCRLDHEDLAGSIDSANAYDTFHDASLATLSANGTVANGDVMGHGTHVCGIVGAQTNNGIGMAGASYGAEVLPIKVFNDGTTSASAKASTANIIKGYAYLSDLVETGKVSNLKVINLSLGYYSDGSTATDIAFEQAISSMRTKHGVLTVCAGGNGDAQGNPLTGKSLPSDFDECLAVTSLDRDGGNTVWSDYNQYKDISAPGISVTSASYNNPTGYRMLSGTSMASPLVAGIAALLWTTTPGLTVDQVVSALEDTADPIVDAENDRSQTSGSHGSVNAQAALASVLPEDPGEPAADVANASNLVVVVQFSDTLGVSRDGYNAAYPYYSEANGIRTKWEYLKKRFNEKNMSYTTTFRDYLATISNGKHDVVSVFPQDNATTGTVSYITLDQPCSYYANYDAQGNDYALISDTLAKLNAQYPALDTSAIDLNDDGAVDNLLIVPTAPSGGTFTSHKSVAAGWSATVGSVQPKTVYTYNVVETTFSDESGTVSDTFEYETAAHEYLHSLGVPDLYRRGVGASGSPVGIWDIMAVSGARSWPLALTRQSLGWTTIADATGEKTRTLYAPDSGKEQAIILASPLSESEYFVVEYRKKNTGVSACDARIGGSGLIVYRVNPAYAEEGNASSRDYAYIFREGETGIGDSSGDVTNAQVGMPSYGAPRQSIGTTDMARGITDGALCYSDGRNSGIAINVTDQEDGSVSFDIAYANYEAAGYWKSAANSDGSTLLPGSNAMELDTATDGSHAYVLVGTTDPTTGATQQGVWKYDGSVWSSLGAAANGLSNSTIAWHEGALYLLGASYTGGSSYVVLKRCENGVWVDVARVSTGSTYANVPVMGVAAGSLHVLIDKDNANAQLYRLQDSSLQAIGAVLPAGYVVHPEIVEVAGEVAVACGDFSFNESAAASATNIYRQNSGGSWETVLNQSGESPVSVSGAAAQGKTYIFCTYNTGVPRLYVVDGGGRIEATVAYDKLADCKSASSLTVGSEYVYLSCIDGHANGQAYAFAQNDPTQLISVGAGVYSPSDSVSLLRADSKVYCGVINVSTRAADVRVHDALEQEDMLSVEAPVASSLTYGYAQASATTVTVKNEGESTVNGLTAALVSGSNAFEMGSLSKSSLAPDETAVCTYRLKNGLDAGRYAGEVRVSTSKTPSAAAYSFSQEVKPLSIALGVLYERGALSPGVAAKDWSGRQIVLSSGWNVGVGSFSLASPDVSLSYGNNVNVGTATVVVRATSPNYTGSFSVPFSIRKVSHWERLGGATAFDTMASISRRSYPSGSGTVILATFDGYWDALTASSLASFENAPILLTSGASLTAQTKTEIQRLGAKKAVIVGGTAAVSSGVSDEVKSLGLSVTRHEGQTATDTAVQVYAAKKGQWSKTAIVATADGYWDALSAAPYSYAKHAPIFLAEIRDHRLSDRTLAAIREGGFTDVVIVGGTAAVSDSVEGQVRSLGVTPTRLSGATAGSTSLAIAKHAIEQGMSARYAGIATIDGYWDALTGAALCGKNNSVLMLASAGDRSCSNGMIALSNNSTFLTSRSAQLQHGYVFGGTAAVPVSMVDQLESMYVGT